MATQENPETIDARELVVVDQSPVSISRAPDEVLTEAQKAASALKKVLDSKKKKVTFNGEQYLEFEDWQTVAKFYGVSVRVVSTAPVEIGDVTGYEARAEVLDTRNGLTVSAAEAMCLNDEPNWKRKPLFQLRSMAQTRASAKALRNVLAWVVVLAGYKPTPAEEMDGVFPSSNADHAARRTETKKNLETAKARAEEAGKPNDRGVIIAKAADTEERIYGSNMSQRQNARKKYGLVNTKSEPTASFTDATYDSLVGYLFKLEKREKEGEDAE